MEKEPRYIYEFINEIFVVCPNCERKAMVKSNRANRRETKFICVHCGTTKQWIGEYNAYTFGVHGISSNAIAIGQPVDCYFKYALWYKKTIKGNVLFAYNPDHLSFLEDYIGSKLRRRQKKDGQWSNASLQSRLPRWMVQSKNRNEILKGINELKEK